MHYEQARFALQHGVHVLVQKPFTVRVDHAEKLVALAEKNSLYLVVSYQRFFEDKSAFARELVASGHIGEVHGVACRITQNWGNPRGWRGDPELAGGGFMMDTGSHLVSSMLRITGLKPVEVRGVVKNYDKRVDLASVVILQFENGALGTLSFFGTVKRFEESISIHGTTGNILLNAGQSKPKQLLVNDEEMTPPARFKPSNPDSMLIQWIRTGGKGYEPPTAAINTIKVTQAIYRAAREGKPVKIKLQASS
jgi:predicted dehydrogenase